jgi:hypothetical protein
MDHQCRGITHLLAGKNNMRRMLFIVPVLLVGCLVADHASKAQQDQPPKTNAVQTEMKNVMYHFTDTVTVHILELHGMLVASRQEGLPIFDDSRSFTLAINFAELSMSTDSLANVLNQYVFAAPDAPIKDLTVTAEGNALKVKGKLHSKGDISFETVGTIAATPEGQIRIHAEKVKAAHLPVKGLMDLLGLKIADLINTKKLRGVRSEENDLILDPQQILPPPHIEGRITAVRIQGNQIVQIFGNKPKAESTPAFTGNYMAYRGAQLRFGKLTMTDTDMILIDMDPKDPFDFYLDHYRDQLVAGYTKITPEFGLRVFMRDFHKLRKAPSTKTPKH